MTYVTSHIGAEDLGGHARRQGRETLLTRVMVGYSYFAFLMLAGFFSPLFGNEDGSAPLKALFLPIMFLIYGGAIFFLLVVTRLRRALGQYLAGNASLVISMLLIAMSAAWSDDPSTTVRRTGALVGSTATALFCGLLHGNAFRALDFRRLKTIMKNPLLVDLRNVYPAEQVSRYGFEYHGIGRREGDN